MADFAEKLYTSTYRVPDTKGGTIVIDNGTYELRAGYAGSPSILVRNRIYKNKEKVSFEPFPLASMKTMFDGDIVVNFDVLEHTIDLLLEHIKPDSLEDLIITNTAYGPTDAELVGFLFSVYKFNRVQIGLDFVYVYHRYFDTKDCLVISAKYSSIMVAYVCGGKIDELYKINFGGKDMLEYINYVMVDKYKEFRRDYRGLAEHIRVSDDYSQETQDIYDEMCRGEYGRNIFLSSAREEQAERLVKKPKKVATQSAAVPALDYALLATEDGMLDGASLKEKRRQKMIYFGTMHRLRTRIERHLRGLGEAIEALEEELEQQYDPAAYLQRKKRRFAKLKREQELRDKLRQDARNRKTREFQIKNKEGLLDAEEQRLKDAITDAEDDEQEAALASRLDEMAAAIQSLDSDFIPFYANTVEILRGDNIGRQCVNIELIKWPEILFEPSIIGSEQMGLTEILESVCAKYAVENALICGGFSYIENFAGRIERILRVLTSVESLRVVQAGDAQADVYAGARFSPLCPTYTREEFEKYDADELIRMNKKY